MTEIEKKALALVNEAFREPYYKNWSQVPQDCLSDALIRAIEQHDAFKREVSDAVEKTANEVYADSSLIVRSQMKRFIIPKPVDPLVEALKVCGFEYTGTRVAEELRAALAARGLEIKEKE